MPLRKLSFFTHIKPPNIFTHANSTGYWVHFPSFRKIMLYNNELRFAALTIDWNDGMLEKWNDGMAPFGQINACGGGLKDRWFCRHFLP
jgi:hypothetical protein